MVGGVARAHVQQVEDVLRGKETDRGVAAKDNRLVGIIVNNAGDRRDSGGLAFLDRIVGFVKWMNCSIVTAMMPIERSRHHETLTQEPLTEVQGPSGTGSITRGGDAGGAGLERFIARDAREYVSIAVALANDRQELATLRAGLRERMLVSPNTDGARLTRFLEAAYTKMWKDYCLRTDS